MTKNLILAHLTQITPHLQPQIFFLQVLPLLVIRNCSKLSSYTI